MTKYQQFFDDMIIANKQAFDEFRVVHDNFAKDPKKWKQEFDNLGRDVQDIIRRYEDRLCRHSESSGYGRYSGNLAEKFQEEVRKVFPKIDAVGME